MWIARSKDGTLQLFKTKPVRSSISSDRGTCIEFWGEENVFGECDKLMCYTNEYLDIEDEQFDDLTWDDEPIEVEIVRKDEKLLAYCYNCKSTFSYDKKTLEESKTMSVKCPTCGTDICLLD